MNPPSEVWDQIDRMSRISCCNAASGETCNGFHPQGTRIVYGYEALSKGVRGAVYSARNAALDAAVDAVSSLLTTDALVLKSEVLEILSRLKMGSTI